MKKILSFASLLAAAVMLISCGEITPDGPEINATGISLKCDKDVIKCDGNDFSALTVVADDGTEIKEGVTFFDGEMNEISISNFKFQTTQEGTYTIWAAYKTFNSAQITIRAINADIPNVVADPNPSSTSFVRRIFLNQFTGTGCGYCPSMVYTLRKVLADNGFGERVVLAASHSYNTNDPAYISSPNAGNFGGSGYPYLAVDMAVGFAEHNSAPKLTSTLQSRYDAEAAKVGISANPKFVENLFPNATGTYEDYLVVRVAVKAAEAGEYTVGAWLLEDKIFGNQDDYTGIKKSDKEHDYDTHDNCLRVADSKSGNSWAGHKLGKMEVGETVSKTFLIRVKDSWKFENLHMAIFVGAKNEKGSYVINNVVDCPVNSATAFEYKK